MTNNSTTAATHQQKKAPLACRKAAKDSTKNIRKSAEKGTATMQERKKKRIFCFYDKSVAWPRANNSTTAAKKCIFRPPSGANPLGMLSFGGIKMHFFDPLLEPIPSVY